MSGKPPALTRISRRLLCQTRLGHALSSGLNRVGLRDMARVTSRHTGYVPDIVAFNCVGSFRLPCKELRLSSANGDDHVARVVWNDGASQYEKPLPRLIAALAQHAADCVFVGANTGFYVLLAASMNTRGRVFGFEPYCRAREVFSSNIALNGLESRIEIVPMAVGELPGKAQLNLPIARFGSTIETSASLSSTFHTVIGESHIVDVTTLDQWQAERRCSIDLLHIDAEGFEGPILAGAPRVIDERRPHIIVEVLERAVDSVRLVNDIVAKQDYVPLRLEEGRITQCDSLVPSKSSPNQWLIPRERLALAIDVSREMGIDFVAGVSAALPSNRLNEESR